MASIAGGSFGAPSNRISITTPTLSSSSLFPPLTLQLGNKKDNQLRCAVQESSTTSTVATEKKDKEKEESTVAAVPAKKPKPAAAKAAAVAKPLRQMMEEDVIPPLIAILEAQDDISELELSFQEDNKLEGFFLKKGISYSFWAFFPTGNLTGAKGFSISSHGSGPSTVEPFLVDERKPTANHVVFWVEKRLAAQGIIPVWNQ